MKFRAPRHRGRQHPEQSLVTAHSVDIPQLDRDTRARRPTESLMLNSITKQRLNQIFTAVGLRQKGFHTPYDHIASTSWAVSPYPVIQQSFEALTPRFLHFVESIAEHAENIAAMRDSSGDPKWNTRWLSPLDMAALYTFVATTRPGKIIEVGSGVTTHTIARAISDHGLPTELICIDPMPRIRIDGCPSTFLKRTFSEKDIDLCATLGENDVLFIDSSHFLQQGFDVDILFNRVFFELQPGTVVHIHDVFLPFGYPDTWQRFRFNEQNALIGWIGTGFFDVLFAAHFVWRTQEEYLARKIPNLDLTCPENAGSIWLKKT
jgi:predicted O-methyltransferase YrrM